MQIANVYIPLQIHNMNDPNKTDIFDAIFPDLKKFLLLREKNNLRGFYYDGICYRVLNPNKFCNMMEFSTDFPGLIYQVFFDENYKIIEVKLRN
jgi:hypothetical protein